MLLSVFAQIPPTPTMLPSTPAPLDIPTFELWDVTDTLLQFWNSSGIATGSQYLIIAALVLIGLFVFIHYLRQIARRDES